MRMLFAVVAVCVVGLGCSIIDTPCKTFGEVHCVGAKTSAVCLGAEYHWTEVACPGGCSSDVCDFTGVEADTPCPASEAGKGHCEERQGTSVAVICDAASKRWRVQACTGMCHEFTTEFDGGAAGTVACR